MFSNMARALLFLCFIDVRLPLSANPSRQSLTDKDLYASRALDGGLLGAFHSQAGTRRLLSIMLLCTVKAFTPGSRFIKGQNETE